MRSRRPRRCRLRGRGSNGLLRRGKVTIAVENGEHSGIWPVIDSEDAQVREVYSRYGLAMFMAQALEHGMVNAMLVLRLLPTVDSFTDRESWNVAFDEFHDAHFAKTFGNMIRALERISAIPDQLITRLRNAKIHRDRLAHRFFRDHAENFSSDHGRVLMIADCERLIELFRGIDAEIDALTLGVRTQFGITDERVREYADKLKAKANNL